MYTASTQFKMANESSNGDSKINFYSENTLITHIVLLKVAEHIKPTDIIQIMESLGNLRYTTIQQIQEFSYGENNSPESLNRNYNYAFIMKFVSPADRDYYVSHPDHKKIAGQLIDNLVDGINSVLVIDF